MLAGLVHITGKKAADIAHDSCNVLKVYSITQQDSFRLSMTQLHWFYLQED